jgi:hypothetical protein
MGQAEWIAVLAIAAATMGGAIGWMMRISRGLTKLEAMVFRIEKVEDTVERHGERLEGHSTRITVLEAHDPS